MSVYFIDEDYGKFNTWILEGHLLGLNMVPIGNADSAFNTLVEADDVELAIIDVMLSARPNGRRFTPERTHTYERTGLALAEDLAREGGPAFPKRCVFLTNAVSDDILRAAGSIARSLEIPLWQKIQIYSPYDFKCKLVEQLAELAGESMDGRP